MGSSPHRRASNRAYDAKRRAEHPWRAWYKDARWVKGRDIHLQRNPLCVMCLARGVTKAADVVDHIIPHRGDEQLFFDSEKNWQSLCAHDHDVHKQRLEQRGYSDQLDADGWPVDPLHPANGSTRGVVKSLQLSRAGPAAPPTRAISRYSEEGGSSSGFSDEAA